MKDKLKHQLNEARDNLQRIRDEFKDDPELLNIYEPSAMYLVDQLKNDDQVCLCFKR